MALNINGTTGISGVDGSASAPALQGSDSNTGVSFGTDTVNINTGGTTRATVDSAGRLLLGTTTEGYAGAEDLTISKSGDTGITIRSSTSGSGTLAFSDGTSGDDEYRGYVQYSHGNNNILFGTNAVERMRLTSSGDVRLPFPDSSTGLRQKIQFVTESPHFDEVGYIAMNRTATQSAPSDMVFASGTAGSVSEKMRIGSNGQIGMPHHGGNYTVGTRLYVSYIYDSTANVANAITIASRPDALVTKHIRFWYTQHGSGGGSELGSITSNNAGSVSYNTSSDYRLKENVTAISDGITRLKKLKPYRFNFKEVPDTVVDGFFAHEAAIAVPECCTGEKDAVDSEGNINPQSIDQSKLVPLLTAALQEAIAKIEVLETKVAALEAA